MLYNLFENRDFVSVFAVALLAEGVDRNSKRSNKAAQGDKSLTVDVDMMIVGGVYQDGVAPV